MSVIIECFDGMRIGKDIEPQYGAVGCVVGTDYIIAKKTDEIDGETKAPVYKESHRISLKDDPAAEVAYPTIESRPGGSDKDPA